jgi:hypothetical protein
LRAIPQERARSYNCSCNYRFLYCRLAITTLFINNLLALQK